MPELIVGRMDISSIALTGSSPTRLAPFAAAPPGECSIAEICEEMARVVGSAEFDTSDRNRRFLEYVITETLAGRANRIKAYNIATEVFGRGVDFDPQMDPVVRMEARRLRRSLERYYLTAGRDNRVKISMPKGRYVPEFRLAVLPACPNCQDEQAAMNGSGPTGPDRLAVRIDPFVTEGDESAFLNFARGLTNEIIISLTHRPELSVFVGAAADPSHDCASAPDGATGGHTEFVLAGSTALFEGFASIKAVLTEMGSGRVVWGETFERTLQGENLLRVRDEVADVIVRTLMRRCSAFTRDLRGNTASLP